jgi:hypothetical protein
VYSNAQIGAKKDKKIRSLEVRIARRSFDVFCSGGRQDKGVGEEWPEEAVLWRQLETTLRHERDFAQLFGFDLPRKEEALVAPWW